MTRIEFELAYRISRLAATHGKKVVFSGEIELYSPIPLETIILTQEVMDAADKCWSHHADNFKSWLNPERWEYWRDAMVDRFPELFFAPKRLFCHHCGSEDLEYLGVDDGGGDYGTSVCDEYGCLNCGNVLEVNCWECDDDDYPDKSDPEPNPNFYVDELGGLNYYFPDDGSLDDLPPEFDPPSDNVGDIPF